MRGAGGGSGGANAEAASEGGGGRGHRASSGGLGMRGSAVRVTGTACSRGAVSASATGLEAGSDSATGFTGEAGARGRATWAGASRSCAWGLRASGGCSGRVAGSAGCDNRGDGSTPWGRGRSGRCSMGTFALRGGTDGALRSGDALRSGGSARTAGLGVRASGTPASEIIPGSETVAAGGTSVLPTRRAPTGASFRETASRATPSRGPTSLAVACTDCFRGGGSGRSGGRSRSAAEGGDASREPVSTARDGASGARAREGTRRATGRDSTCSPCPPRRVGAGCEGASRRVGPCSVEEPRLSVGPGRAEGSRAWSSGAALAGFPTAPPREGGSARGLALVPGESLGNRAPTSVTTGGRIHRVHRADGALLCSGGLLCAGGRLCSGALLCSGATSSSNGSRLERTAGGAADSGGTGRTGAACPSGATFGGGSKKGVSARGGVAGASPERPSGSLMPRARGTVPPLRSGALKKRERDDGRLIRVPARWPRVEPARARRR